LRKRKKLGCGAVGEVDSATGRTIRRDERDKGAWRRVMDLSKARVKKERPRQTKAGKMDRWLSGEKMFKSARKEKKRRPVGLNAHRGRT